MKTTFLKLKYNSLAFVLGLFGCLFVGEVYGQTVTYYIVVETNTIYTSTVEDNNGNRYTAYCVNPGKSAPVIGTIYYPAPPGYPNNTTTPIAVPADPRFQDKYLTLIPNLSCSITAISTSVGSCSLSNNTYSISGSISVSNPPSDGALYVYIDNTVKQVIPYTSFSTSITYSISSSIADGQSHTIKAVFANNNGATDCQLSSTFSSPASCGCVNPSPSVNSPTICSGNSATLTVSNCAGSVSWNDGTTGLTKVASPTATTSYTATCTVGTCSGSATGTVSVTSKPVPSVNSPTICSGSGATLSVSNCGGSVTWNDGTSGVSRTVYPSTTSSYTATCTIGTCSGTATSTVSVTSKPTPSVNSPTICSGSGATLSVSNCGGSVTWNDGTSGVSRTVYPSTTTSYTATCTVGTCSGSATGTVYVTTKPVPSVNSPTICSGSGATLSVSNCGGNVTWNDGTTGLTKVASPTATTSYTATCTVGTCSGSATSTVSVTSKPTPSVNSPTICSGSSATLTVTNCSGSVTWNDGTTGLTKVVSPTATSSYTATCTIVACSGTATSTVSVTSKPTPSVNSPTICSGSSATLTVTNCSGSVSWNDGTTGLTKVVSPTATSSYTATCTVGTCSGTTTSTVTVSSSLAPSVNSPIICSGSSATLTVTNCSGSVSWNDGTTGLTKVVSPTTTTSYTATCTIGTCTGTATSTVTVSSSLAPSVNNPTICSGSSATLTVTNCSGSVSWNDGTTGLTKTVSPSVTTSYTATCTVGTCSGTATSTVTVSSLPIISITTSPCAADGLTYSVNFTTNAALVQSDKGVLSGNTVTGIPSGQIVTLTATSAQGCKVIASTTQNCAANCTKPDAGLDIAICLPKTNIDLVDAPTGYTWIVSNSNPSAATVNAQTGVVTDMSINGNYQFVLQKIGDATCSDIVQIQVNNAADPIILCNDGSTSYTIVAPSMLTNVIWYNMAGMQVGTGTSLIVKSTTLGLEDGTEAYYYRGININATTLCDSELCCLVSFRTQTCCQVENCIDITIIKN